MKNNPKLKIYRIPRLRMPSINSSPVLTSARVVEITQARFPAIAIKPKCFFTGINRFQKMASAVVPAKPDLHP